MKQERCHKLLWPAGETWRAGSPPGCSSQWRQWLGWHLGSLVFLIFPQPNPVESLPKWLRGCYFHTTSVIYCHPLPGFGSCLTTDFSRLALPITCDLPPQAWPPHCSSNPLWTTQQDTQRKSLKALQEENPTFYLKRQRLVFPASCSLILSSHCDTKLSVPWIHPVLFLGPYIFPLCLNNYYSSHKSCLNMASLNKSFMAKVKNFSYVIPRHFANYTKW